MALIDIPRRHHYRILALSDQVESQIYGPNLRHIVPNVDFIVGCGDLPVYYLEYIVSSLDRPLLYVHGNHDQSGACSDGVVAAEPLGGINLHRRVYRHEGLLIAGLQGCHRYNRNPYYQYTQHEMWLMVLSLVPRLLRNRLLYGRALDILVTHAPPFGIHDGTDMAHIGFRAFHFLLRYFPPRYLLHGHQHVYTRTATTRTRLGPTEIINVYPFRVLDLDFAPPRSAS